MNLGSVNSTDNQYWLGYYITLIHRSHTYHKVFLSFMVEKGLFIGHVNSSLRTISAHQTHQCLLGSYSTLIQCHHIIAFVDSKVYGLIMNSEHNLSIWQA